ncbi:MAG: hypothetical protein LQ346_001182 [Caloplaca aetnensis]|nr:MAG: hypothetical protein LQ346_001182 [Caloplaca aetnensis]
MANALINQAIQTKRLACMVPMNKFGIVYFGRKDSKGDQKFCIATANLNACHGVAIISRKAAVLGHAAPSHPNFPPGEVYAQYFINGIVQLVNRNENKPYFENQGMDGVLVVGFSQKEGGGTEIVLPHQVEVIAQTLHDTLGHKPKIVEYGPVEWSHLNTRPDKGFVFIEGYESGQLPVMWVEENQVLLR